MTHRTSSPRTRLAYLLTRCPLLAAPRPWHRDTGDWAGRTSWQLISGVVDARSAYRLLSSGCGVCHCEGKTEQAAQAIDRAAVVNKQEGHFSVTYMYSTDRKAFPPSTSQLYPLSFFYGLARQRTQPARRHAHHRLPPPSSHVFSLPARTIVTLPTMFYPLESRWVRLARTTAFLAFCKSGHARITFDVGVLRGLWRHAVYGGQDEVV